MPSLEFAAALMLAGQAAPPASDPCRQYQDQIVSPITMDAAIARFAAVPLDKGEFESSAAFAARQRAALGGELGPMIIGMEPERRHIKYDADAQRLTIERYLFDNSNLAHDIVFGPGTPLHRRIRYSSTGNVGVVISQAETVSGSYEASNAYGAGARVTRLHRVTKAIFDREGDSFSSLFPRGTPQVLVDVRMSPEAAARVKPQLQVAFAVEPKSPYLARGVGSVGRPTISRPIEITNEVTVILADIQCALLMDGSNQVLGSFPTQ